MKATITSLILAAGAVTLSAQTVADSVLGYSGTQGANGWRYGYYDLSGDATPGYDATNDFAQCTIWDGAVWWVSNSDYWTSLTATGGHPNGSINNSVRLLREQWAVRRWVSGFTGAVRIHGHAAKENTACGDGTAITVFLNGRSLFERALNAGDGTGFNFNLEAELATNDLVDFALNAGCCGDVNCDGTIFTAVLERAPVNWQGNGHYYEFVRTNVTWQQAQATAAIRSYAGLPGHLATVTSSAENQFILSNFGTGNSIELAWLGGKEPANDGVWRWVSGPESDVQFSLFATPTAPFDYANWGGVEPNSFKPNEDYLMFNLGQELNGILAGQWADGAPNPSVSDPVVGYLVEYEPLVLDIAKGVQVCFPTETNAQYQLQYAIGVGTTNWSNLGGPIVGTGGTNCVFDAANSPQRFYRVQINP